MSDEQLATIGYISVLWNGIERNLVACIWAAAGWTQEMGELETGGLPNVVRKKLLADIISVSVDDVKLRKQTEATLTLFEGMRVARNDLMHGFFDWSYRSSQTRGTLKKITARKGKKALESRLVPVTQERLDQIVDSMILCQESLWDLLHKLIFRQRFLKGERGPLAATYEDAVHGWRAPAFDIEELRRRTEEVC